MFSIMLDNTIMLPVCVTDMDCLKNKGITLQIQYNNIDVVLCQLFMIASNFQQLKQIFMINKCVLSLLYYIG